MTLRILLVCAVSTAEQAEKESIESQRNNGLAYADTVGGHIIDIVEIPGYSRRFYTLRELVEAAARDDFHGPARLEEHIVNKTFDIMWVQVTNRFNREQSLNAEIIARVIRECRARIYSASDGMIDESNFRAFIAITGYRDSTEIDELVRRRKMGILGVARKGLPVSNRVAMSHRLIRNPDTGKADHLELRNELIPMWRNLATLILEGVAYQLLETEMFNRWGYGKNGKPYNAGKFHQLLLRPGFWGNNVVRWKRHAKAHLIGVWAFDRGIKPPAGVELFWDTHEPALTGDLAEAVQSELKRRTEVYNTYNTTVERTKQFAGLIYCDECWWRYSYNYTRNPQGRMYYYLRCNNAPRKVYGACSQKKQLKESEVKRWINEKLEDWVESGHVVIDETPERDGRSDELKETLDALRILERRRDNLIDELGDSDDSMRTAIRQRIGAINEQVTVLKSKSADLQQDIIRVRSYTRSQQIGLQQLRDIGLPAFWEQDWLTINRALKQIFGPSRLYARDGEIKGFFSLEDLD